MKSLSMLLMCLLEKVKFLTDDDYLSANLIFIRRENKPSQIEDIFDKSRSKRCGKNPVISIQRPIEQIIREVMTDNNTRNRGCHYHM